MKQTSCFPPLHTEYLSLKKKKQNPPPPRKKKKKKIPAQPPRKIYFQMPTSKSVKQKDDDGRNSKKANSKSVENSGLRSTPTKQNQGPIKNHDHDCVVYEFHIPWEQSKSPFLNSRAYIGTGFHWVFLCSPSSYRHAQVSIHCCSDSY